MTAPRVIGIDASRALVHERTGTESYSFHLLQALANRQPAWLYRAYVNAQDVDRAGLPDSLEIRCIPFPRLWTHGRLSFEMVRHPPNLLFVPAHVIPALHPPSVVTIHDLGYLRFPEAHPPAQRRMLDLTTRWSARVARQVIAPSHATALDLRRHYAVDPDAITVISHGVSTAFSPAAEDEQRRIREVYGLRRPFVLSVGTIQPRKNYGRLAAAVHALVAEGQDIDLVISGRTGWLPESALDEIHRAGLRDRLHLLGYVPATDLPALYATANVFALVSLYEGFGLPALEAMASGTPTVVAGGSSLPEITGAAGLIVDPRSVDEIANAIRALLDDAALRWRLAAEGLDRAKRFTWDRAAAQTEEVFRRALTGRRA